MSTKLAEPPRRRSPPRWWGWRPYRRRRRPPSVFVSYRRSDAAGHASRFDDLAARRYGRARVFRDTESIDPADPWRQRLDDELDRAAIVVAVVGPDWAGGTGKHARIFQPGDMVAHELAAAGTRNIPVVPTLVGGARLPHDDDLPAALAFLLQLQSVAVVPGQERPGHHQVLRRADTALGWWGRARNRTLTGVAVVLAMVLVAGVAVLRPRPQLARFTTSESAVLLVPAVEPESDTGTGDDSVRTTDPATRFTRQLGQELTQRFAESVVKVADPAFAPLSATRSEQEAALRRLVTDSNADVLVTGRLVRSATETDFVPQVYVGSILDAEDLAGLSLDVDTIDLRGVDADIDVVPGASARLAGQAAGALAPVGVLLDALGSYERRDLERAEALFTSLLDGSTIGSTASRAVLFHLRGNARADLADLDGAQQDYQTALDLDPGFERSALGLAEVELLRARGPSCAAAGVDAQRLSTAEQRYRRLQQGSQDDTVRAKAQVGLARVDACRVDAFRDVPGIRDPSARRAYDSLDELLDDSQPPASAELTETLAVAHLTRAALTVGLRDQPDVGRDPETAAGDLQRVRQLTRRPWLKADAQLALGRLRAARPDLGSAAEAYRQACDDLLRTLDAGPGPAIEKVTLKHVGEVNAAGVDCSAI